jgi:gliding motility-associated-like protein
MPVPHRLVLLLLFSLTACASTLAQGGFRFIENKGQWPGQVTHRAEMPGATLWIERGAVVIDRFDQELLDRAHANIAFDPTAPANSQLDHHAVRLKFLNAPVTPRNEASTLLTGHYNYFIGNDPGKWAIHARPFAMLTMVAVAPGCDAVFREGRSGLKYDLVLAPGADPAAIQFTYEGADALSLRNGALLVETSLGRLVERIPLAYQDLNGERRPVTCSYTLKRGVIGVRPGPYDKAHPLVIDPELSFATYSGSVSNNFGYTATSDAAGFLYAGSTAFGNQYPTTLGAYRTTWAGGTTDIALTKYDTTGTFLVWSTYLGGSAAEMPHSLIVDQNDQLVVLGTTASTDFPTSAGAYDASFAGGTPFTPSGLGLSYPNGSDMIVARLNANGSALIGSTYLGGSGNDGLNSATALKFNYADEVRGEVLLDPSGNVWVTSCTQSANMPVTPGAAQSSYAGGSHDGYVALLNPGLSQLLYGSYIGGSGADAVYAGELDPAGRLFVCGGTTSTDLPTSSNALSTTFNGGQADAFVARFNTTGSAIDALSYWGSPAYDQAYFVEIDGPGDIYLFGQTSAPSGSLVFNAPYNLPGGGQFITKLNSELSTLLLSSRIGSGDGTPDISPTAFLVDVCDKIYTSGWGSSAGGLGGTLTTTGLPVTSDAHQSTTTGHDLYLAVFDINMDALSYATFYGGSVSPEHVDGGTSRFDRRGRVYQSVCAGCQNNDDFPTTPGAWSSTNNSTGCNNGLLKFDFDAPLVIAAFTAPDTVCANVPIPFTNLSNDAASQSWDFGDGIGTSTVTSPTYTYAQPGTYTVTLTVVNGLTCNGQDLATRTIVVAGATPFLQAMNDTLVCGPVASFTLFANSNGDADSFHWSTNAQFTDRLNQDAADSTATISPTASGTYYVQATTNDGCPARDSVSVVISLGSIALEGDTLICAADTARLALIGADAGSTITWSPSEAIIGGQGTTTIIVAPVESASYSVTVSAPSGCTWTSTFTVAVSPINASSISASVDQAIVLPGTTVQLLATPSEGVTYSWSPAAPLSDPTIADPTALVQATTLFTVAVSDGICTRNASVEVKVYELLCAGPDIFVPNTFTPNGDGSNDQLLVRGRHIERMEFMVFNRWGEKVFETTDRSIGWDGTFEGRPVDPAVFVYHLTAWCVDGQRYFTKGNVTVVR